VHREVALRANPKAFPHQFRQFGDVHHDPLRLVLGEQLGCWATARLILEIDMGEPLPRWWLMFGFVGADRFSQPRIDHWASCDFCIFARSENCPLYWKLIAWSINGDAPLLSRNSYSDRVPNASMPMLHKIDLNPNRRFFGCDADHKIQHHFWCWSQKFAFSASSVSHHILRPRLGLLHAWIHFGEKCYAYHHDEDMRSALYLRAASSGDLYGR
jgi:hypothetical protein